MIFGFYAQLPVDTTKIVFRMGIANIPIGSVKIVEQQTSQLFCTVFEKRARND